MSTPTLHIKSAARKLPIKRKNTSPDLHPLGPIDPPKPEPFAPTTPYDDDEDDDDGDDDIDDDLAVVTSSGDLNPPPFKFHRIWSESDEIRFLQGLMGCRSRDMVFPRDLNLFYDRFSESMPQPYTRSQLSEKLRRLRKKYRIMSARIARGQDPARLAPHDRDLLHLCTRLWHPSHAASSPFAAPEGAAPPVGNKRRRPNPRPPTSVAASSSTPLPTALLALPAPADDKVFRSNNGNHASDSHPGGIGKAKPLSPPQPAKTVGEGGKVGALHPLAKSVLDIFDGTLNEMRERLLGNGMLQQDGSSSDFIGRDFTRRWQAQRIAEMDMLARRLRLVIEDSPSKVELN